MCIRDRKSTAALADSLSGSRTVAAVGDAAKLEDAAFAATLSRFERKKK